MAHNHPYCGQQYSYINDIDRLRRELIRSQEENRDLIRMNVHLKDVIHTLHHELCKHPHRHHHKHGHHKICFQGFPECPFIPKPTTAIHVLPSPPWVGIGTYPDLADDDGIWWE